MNVVDLGAKRNEQVKEVCKTKRTCYCSGSRVTVVKIEWLQLFISFDIVFGVERKSESLRRAINERLLIYILPI